ncbi:DUF1254 domain-containing protein [Lutimonas sp.]|uniref:DUF1254 domain-containing protein n=1 Tax=Lutimonas sp. TaxID=1872403 RepID=UPI003D9AE8CE
MKKSRLNYVFLLALMLIIVLVSSCSPSMRTTPENEISKYKFVGGYPTQTTIDKTFDELDIQRVSQIYLEFMPLASQQALFKSHIEESGMNTGDVAVFTETGAGKVNHIGLTYNTESIYATAYIDLKIVGAYVVETPPNVLGIVNDGWMRFVTDLGNAGPDKGEGGKYLIVHNDYDGIIPEGYFVYKTPTYRNWVMVRGFENLTGSGNDAIEYYQQNFKLYPLGHQSEIKNRYFNYSVEKNINTTHPRNESYMKLIHETVQYEPSSAFTAYELGLLKSLGIEKGKDFNPDHRTMDIYKRGIERGDAMAKANAYANRLHDAKVYEDRQYEHLFIGGSHEFMNDDVLNLDARTLFHYEAIVITPAMTNKMIGIGSQYVSGYRDNKGDFLMGENNYKLHLPAGIPAKDFWSVTLYHPDTRSLLENGMIKPSINSYDKPEVNEDGSVDLYFGPKAPIGKEKNWIKTIPGEGWMTLIRLYGPLEPYFDQSWKPNDIEKIQTRN